MEHAQFAPSKLVQYFNCPGSYYMEKNPMLPPETESWAAKKGTELHAIVAEYLSSYKMMLEYGQDPAGFLDASIQNLLQEEDTKLASKALEEVKNLFEIYPPQDIHIETTVYPFKDNMDCYGTADLYYTSIVSKDTAVLVDFKFGAHKVEVVDNIQLYTYGLGIQNATKAQKIVANIIQPQIVGIDSIVLKDDFLHVIGENIKSLIKNITTNNIDTIAYSPSVKACRWCRGKAICPHYTETANKAAVEVFEAHQQILEAAKPIDLDQLFEWYEQAELLKEFIGTIEKQVRHVLAHKPTNGYKLVRTRGVRTWIVDDNIERKVQEAVGENVDIFKSELKTPPALIKEYPQLKKNKELEKLIIKGEGKSLSIVSEDDPRPAWIENPFEGLED